MKNGPESSARDAMTCSSISPGIPVTCVLSDGHQSKHMAAVVRIWP